MPAVYLVLGLPGSGRHEILANLVADAMADTGAITVYRAQGIKTEPEEPALARLAARPGLTITNYNFALGQFYIAAGAEPKTAPGTVFFLTDGRASPIDQMEAFPAWLSSRGWELSRIFVVVHCALAAKHPEVELWHDACIHFADCVLLSRREGVPQVWLQQFQKKFAALHYPCLFFHVKKGHIQDTHLLLFPEARRISHIFDDIDPVDELELDEDNLPEEPFTLENKPDPYFERTPNGQRCLPVPDVTAFLPR